MRRRELITLIGLAAAWPLAARAQQSEPMRRIGILMTLAADDPLAQARVAAFLQGLQQVGWVVGRNVSIDIRWGANDGERSRREAAALLAASPDVILATGSTTVGPLLQMTRSVPVVFVIVPDPIGAGYVASLARPGGNATGFGQFEFGLSAKWLELLKQVAPRVTRAAVLRDRSSIGMGQFGAIQAVAPSFGIETVPINVSEPNEIERDIGAFARSDTSGLILTSSPLAATHRELIIRLVERHRLPAVYYERYLVTAGGLISYGPDFLDQYRQASGYVDRILKGDKPADLPVQAPTKYELAINLKTAKALGLEIPPTLLARADAVIE
jgi:putative ABC transport system substrate-binding protein